MLASQRSKRRPQRHVDRMACLVLGEGAVGGRRAPRGSRAAGARALTPPPAGERELLLGGASCPSSAAGHLNRAIVLSRTASRGDEENWDGDFDLEAGTVTDPFHAVAFTEPYVAEWRRRSLRRTLPSAFTETYVAVAAGGDVRHLTGCEGAVTVERRKVRDWRRLQACACRSLGSRQRQSLSVRYV